MPVDYYAITSKSIDTNSTTSLTPDDEALFIESSSDHKKILLHKVSKTGKLNDLAEKSYENLTSKPKLNTMDTSGDLPSVPNETIDGTIYLHKVSKSGKLNDLAEKSYENLTDKPQLYRHRIVVDLNQLYVDGAGSTWANTYKPVIVFDFVSYKQRFKNNSASSSSDYYSELISVIYAASTSVDWLINPTDSVYVANVVYVNDRENTNFAKLEVKALPFCVHVQHPLNNSFEFIIGDPYYGAVTITRQSLTKSVILSEIDTDLLPTYSQPY